MNRRQALISTFGSLVLPFRFWQLAPISTGMNAAQVQVETLIRKDLPDLGRGDTAPSVSVLRVRYAPGDQNRPHIHPVPAFVYVLRGVIESQVKGEKIRRYASGEYFFEEPRHAHLVARNASSTDPAEFLALFVGKSNSPLTVPLGDGNGSRR